MSINSRNKGASAEREIATIIFNSLGVKLHRNLEQYQSGGFDLSVDSGQDGPVTDYINSYAIEIKRYKQATAAKINAWFAQAVRQAKDVNKRPLLIYREDRQGWRVVMEFMTGTVETDLDTFCLMARELYFMPVGK